MQAIRHALLGTVLPHVKIPELYMLNVHAVVEEFLQVARNRVPPTPVSNTQSDFASLRLIQDPLFRRLRATIDMELALTLYNVYRFEKYLLRGKVFLV